MQEVLRKAIVEALGQEHWTVLSGHQRLGFEDTFQQIHAMRNGGVVCWWNLIPIPAKASLLLQCRVEYHGFYADRELELTNEITKHIRDIPDAMRHEARRLLDQGHTFLDMGNEFEAHYVNMARNMATEWVPLLVPHFRQLLRATLDDAMQHHRDYRPPISAVAEKIVRRTTRRPTW